MPYNPMYQQHPVGNLTVPPPSFVPQINDLGSMIDTFTQRRIALAKMEEQERVNREKDAYYRGRIAAKEKRDATSARTGWMRQNQAEKDRWSRNPHTTAVWIDPETGQAHNISSALEGAEAPTADVSAGQPDIPAPTQGAGDVIMEPGAPPAGDEELDSLMRSTLPGAPKASVTTVPTPQTRGDARYNRAAATGEPGYDDFEERARRMSSRQTDDMRTAYDAMERGESGLVPSEHNRDMAEFYGRNASGDFETMQGNYEAMKAAQRGGPQAEVTAVPPQQIQGDVHREPDTVFFDELNDDMVQALTGPDDQRTMHLQPDAFPPGAREGDRFAAEDVGEDGRKGNPFAEPISRSPGQQDKTVFLDELDDGDATGRTGQLDQQRLDLAQDSFPPGAREGDRFAREDVGEGGRKGNPWGEPLDVEPMAQPERQEIPPEGLNLSRPNAEVTAVPPTVAEGDVHDLRQQPSGRRWVARLPNGEEWAVDEGAKAQMADADRRERIRRYEEAFDLASPRDKVRIAEYIAQERMGLSEGRAKQMSDQSFRREERIEGQEYKSGEAEKQRQFTGEQNAAKLQTQKEIAAMRRRRSGRLAPRVTDTSGDGSAWQALDPKEQRAFRQVYQREENGWARRVNWDKLEGAGVDRLKLADWNINAKGEFATTQHVEAMMNFFGYIRGGVPAKNETELWEQKTGTLKNKVNSIGQFFGKPNLWESLSGGDVDKATQEFATPNSRMTPQQRAELAKAIRESIGVVQSSGAKNIDVLASRFESEDAAHREYITPKLNSFRRFLGLGERQFYSDVPLGQSKLMPEGQAGGESRAPTGASQPAAAPAPGAPEKKVSLKEEFEL